MNIQRNGGKGRNGSKVILVGEQHINHALRNTLIKHFDKHTTLQGVTFFAEGYSVSISKDPKVQEGGLLFTSKQEQRKIQEQLQYKVI